MKKRVLASLLALAMVVGMFPDAAATEAGSSFWEEYQTPVYTVEELRQYLEDDEVQSLAVMADMELDLSVTDEETGEVTEGTLTSDDSIASGIGDWGDYVYTLTVTGGVLEVAAAQITVKSYEELMVWETGENSGICVSDGVPEYMLAGTLEIEEDTVLESGILAVTNAGFVDLAAGTRLICGKGLRNAWPSADEEDEEYWIPLKDKHNGAADMLVQENDGTQHKRVLYADMATMEQYVAADFEDEKVSQILLCRTEGNSAYITVGFDLPCADVIHSDESLEIRPGVTLETTDLYVNGDCIWYPTSEVLVDGELGIEGNCPQLVYRYLERDEDGRLYEPRNAEYHPWMRLAFAGEEALAAVYAVYFNGSRWVAEPVDANALQATGSAWVESACDEAADTSVTHYARLSLEEWDAAEEICAPDIGTFTEDDLTAMGGFEKLSFWVDCYLGDVNFFSEPAYDEDAFLYEYHASAVSGGVVYAASYLPEWDLDVEWYLMDMEGNELRADPWGVFSIAMMEDASGKYQTVWEIEVHPEAIRDYPEGLFLCARGAARYEDGSEGEFNTILPVYPCMALGWTEESIDLDQLSVNEFGMLSDLVRVWAGEEITGRIYMAYYNEDEDCWVADLYCNDGEKPWFLTEGDITVTGGEGLTTIRLDAVTGEESRVYWTNGHMDGEDNWTPNDEADENVLPLWVTARRGQRAAEFYEDADFDANTLDSLEMSPLMDTVFYLGISQEDGVEAKAAPDAGVDGVCITAVKDVPGMYEVVVDRAYSRKLGYDGLDLRVSVALTDGCRSWSETCSISLWNHNTIGWLPCDAVPETVELDALTDVLPMAVGEKQTGAVYFVYYEDGAWQADLYAEEYLWIEDTAYFDMESDPDTGLTTISCLSPGITTLWWRNHIFDDEGNNSPDSGPDYDASFPLRLIATTPYLTYRWLNNEGEGFYEGDDFENGLRITPLDRYALICYLNWFDGEALCWHRVPVIPTAEEEGVTVTPLTPEEIMGEQENSDCFVWLEVDESLWDSGFDLLGTLGEGEDALVGAMGVDVRRHRGGFYSTESMSNDTFVNCWLLPERGGDVLYFGVEDYEGEGTLVEIFAMDGWGEDGEPVYGSPFYDLTDVAGRADLVQVTLHTDEIPADGVWLEVGLLLEDEDGNKWVETGGLTVEHGRAAGFYTHNGEDYQLIENGCMPLSPVADTEFFFYPGLMGDMEGNWTDGGDLTVRKEADGFYRITVPQSVARTVLEEQRVVATTTDAEYYLTLQASPAVVWGDMDEWSIFVTDDEHGLRDALWLTDGRPQIGSVYYVWYNEEEAVWRADRYSDDYLVVESGPFEAYALEDRYGLTRLECWGAETGWLFWTNQHQDEDGSWVPDVGSVDWGAIPLRLNGESGYNGFYYYWDDVNGDAAWDGWTEASPIGGRELFLGFPNEDLKAVKVNGIWLADGRQEGEWLNKQPLKAEALDNGMYRIVITPDMARACVPQKLLVASVEYRDVYGDVWSEEIPLAIAGSNAIGWKEADENGVVTAEQLVITDDSHGLRDRLVMSRDEERVGVVYLVYYDEDYDEGAGAWLADPYGGDYLAMDGDWAFDFYAVCQDEDCDHYNDPTKLVCVGGGQTYLWWVNHATDEEGNIIGPNDSPDETGFPLTLDSTQPCLSVSWLDRDEDGYWYEQGGRSTDCDITPLDGTHHHIFYMNWVDEDGNWQLCPVTDLKVTSVIDAENADMENPPQVSGSFISLDVVQDESDKKELPGHARVRVTEDAWNKVITIAGTYTKGEGEDAVIYKADMELCVELPNLGIYKDAAITEDNYITEVDPVWGEENVFYLGWKDAGMQIEQAEAVSDRISISPVEGSGNTLFRITLHEVYEYGEPVFVNLYLSNEDRLEVGFWVNGAENTDDFLGHRYLRNEGRGWFVNMEKDLHRGIGSMVPGDESWMMFWYAPYGEEPVPVDVKVTQGGDFVTLQKITEMEDEPLVDGAPYGEYYYRLQANRGDVWGEEITLSYIVAEGEGEDTVEKVIASDTFTLERDYVAFFADEDPDLEGYSDYLYDFTLTDTNTSLYLHIQAPEGWYIHDVVDGWEDEDGRWHMFGGEETTKDGNVLYAEDDALLLEITMDPEAAVRNYGNHNYRLNLGVEYEDPDGNIHLWEYGIRILNRVSYLTYSHINRRNDQLVVEEHREDGMWINPQQELFHIYYLNTYNAETGCWEATPVHPEAVCEDDAWQFLHFTPYAEREPEAVASTDPLIWEYGYLVTVDEDSWGEEFAVRGEANGTAGFLWGEVRRDKLNYYNAPSLNDDTFIDFFRLNDLSGGNVLYVGAELDGEDVRIKEVRTDGWTKENGEERDCENGDLVTVTKVTDKAYKVVIDTERALQRHGRHGFDLCLNVVLEDENGTWDNPVSIWVENNLPVLRYTWLEHDEESGGWYLPEEHGYDEGWSMFPGDEFWQVYVMNYYDRAGNWHAVPVIPTVQGEGVEISSLTELEESIAYDQPYAEYFVRVSSAESAWNRDVTLTAAVDGHTAFMGGFVGRSEAEFYASEEIGDDTCLHEFLKNPLQPEKNVLYFAIRKDPNWKVELDVENVTLRAPDEIGEAGTLELVNDGEDYAVFKITLAEAVAANDREFDLMVDYSWIDEEDESTHDRNRRIRIRPGTAEGHVASVEADGSEVQFYQTDDGIVPYIWVYDETAGCSTLHLASDLGMTYDPDSNTLTLTNADLYTLHVNTDVEPGTTTEDLTIALVGENIITGGRRTPALTVEGGMNVTVTAQEEAFLLVKTNNDTADPWTHPAISLWDNGDGDLIIAGKAVVTVHVGGEAYETDEDGNLILENGQTIPAHMHAIQANENSDSGLLVTGNAVLNLLPGEDLLRRWSGANGFREITVEGDARFNTARLELWQEEAALRVLGGEVNVTMLGDDNGDNYYFCGIGIPNGYLSVAGGALNITAPAFDAGDMELYGNGIVVENGSFGIIGGAVNVDMSGFTGNNADRINGCALHLGNSESDGEMRFGQSGGSITVLGGGDDCITAMEIGSNADAELSGGSISARSYQGVRNNGTVNLRRGTSVTLAPVEKEDGTLYATCGEGMFFNDRHYSLRRISALNVYGGELNIISCDHPALLTQGEFLQTGGSVELTFVTQDNVRPTAAFNGRNSITGGEMTLNGPVGISAYPNEYMAQNYFRLVGGDVTVNCDFNGLIAMMPVTLQSGSLSVLQSGADESGADSAVLVEDGSLTVTGGTHVFGGEKAMGFGLRTYNDVAVKFLGGSTHIQGQRGAMVASGEAEMTVNPIQVGDGVWIRSNGQGTDLEYVASQHQEELGNGSMLNLHFLTLTEKLNDERVAAVDVTVEPGEAPPVPTAAHVEVTTARASVGALVTVQATVSAGDGKVTFALSEGLELATDTKNGSITVNGVAYDGGLENIPVEGSAQIVFRVKPMAEGKADVTCTVTPAEGAAVSDSVTFPVYSFRMTAPTYTAYPTVTVRGTGTPDDVITLTVTGGEPVETAVTKLGTFAAEIELPVEEDNDYDAQSFSIVAELNGTQVGETLSVVYNSTSVRLDYLYITNQVVDSAGEPMPSTNTVSYRNGTGMPERSFYTYIPDMNCFDFETEFHVPTGWIITGAKVVVSYQDETIGEEFTDLPMEEVEQTVSDDMTSRTEFWAVSQELPAAPIDFKVVYRVARAKDIVVPGPYDPSGPGVEWREDYEEEEEDRITGTIPVIPIIDPSGTIYSGSLENPVAGATVTLYYGGDGDAPADAQLFDMAPYGQSNPQLSDENGHYSWDVPTGWWKVVAEKNGFRAESQWVRVLPAHTDLHLNLNMAGGKLVDFGLTKISPVTSNGRIPARDFQTEVTVTGFTSREDAVLVVSTYTVDGRFLTMQTRELLDLEQGVTTTVTVDIANADGAVRILRAFLVDGTGNMTPLSDVAEHRDA